MSYNWKPDYNVTPQRVVCAAIKHKNGFVIIGIRHMDEVMRVVIELRQDVFKFENWYGCEQGFVDQFNNYLSRKEAWVIAVKQNQIYRLVGGQTQEDLKRNDIELFSENLY